MRNDLDTSKDFFFQVASLFGGAAAVIPGMKQLYYLFRTPIYRARRQRWPMLLAQEFNLHAPVAFYPHHYCHATSAYFASGFDSALVVTMDGGVTGVLPTFIRRARDGSSAWGP